MTGYVATRHYRAPEAILDPAHYGRPLDMWSFGCIMSELLLAVRPISAHLCPSLPCVCSRVHVYWGWGGKGRKEERKGKKGKKGEGFSLSVSAMDFQALIVSALGGRRVVCWTAMGSECWVPAPHHRHPHYLFPLSADISTGSPFLGMTLVYIHVPPVPPCTRPPWQHAPPPHAPSMNDSSLRRSLRPRDIRSSPPPPTPTHPCAPLHHTHDSSIALSPPIPIPIPIPYTIARL